MLLQMGFTAGTQEGVLSLAPAKPGQMRIAVLKVIHECIFAFMECNILVDIHTALKKQFPFTSVCNVIKLKRRQWPSGTVETCTKALLDKMKWNRSPICIDGSNVAWRHGKNQKISMQGIEIVVDDLINKGFDAETIVVFLGSKFRAGSTLDSEQSEILERLEKKCLVSIAPSKREPSGKIGMIGKIISCHDDYQILSYAAKSNAIVVTTDQFKKESNNPSYPEWNYVIRERILMLTFVRDTLIWPPDPNGKDGPWLADFLRY